MEEEATVFLIRPAYLENAQEPSTVVPPEQETALASPKQTTDTLAVSTSLGVAELTLRLISVVFCIAILVATIMALLAINEVEDYFNDHGREYKHADSYRAAARWLTCMAVLGIFFHYVMIFVRYLYLTSRVKSAFTVYAYLNAALCIVFDLSLFAGGVSNAFYAANNADNIVNICDQYFSSNMEFCYAFKRIRDAEAAAASMSFFAMVIFAILIIFMISCGIMNSQKAQGQNAELSSSNSDGTAAAGALSSESHGVASSYMPLNAPLRRPIDAPPPYTPHN